MDFIYFVSAGHVPAGDFTLFQGVGPPEIDPIVLKGGVENLRTIPGRVNIFYRCFKTFIHQDARFFLDACILDARRIRLVLFPGKDDIPI